MKEIGAQIQDSQLMPIKLTPIITNGQSGEFAVRTLKV